MTGTIDITCSLPAPTLAQVRAWLTREGWTEHEDGRSIWPVPRWTPPGPPAHALHLYDIADAVQNIARITSRAPEAVYREIVGPAKVWLVTGFGSDGAQAFAVACLSEETANRIACDHVSGPESASTYSIEECEVRP